MPEFKTIHNPPQYPSGLCSAHQIASPTCSICNPVIGDLEQRVAELKEKLAEVAELTQQQASLLDRIQLAVSRFCTSCGR